MSNRYKRRLQLLQQQSNKKLFNGIRHGIEREGLRVKVDKHLSDSSHPEILGKTLTHPYITTDYSEALLEFITPVYCQVEDVMHFLEDLHSYTCRNLQNEYVWAGSMPAQLEGEQSIPIAHYGTSNVGIMKYIYREGLAHRYGKAMQTIAGIHYNFSLPEGIWALFSEQESNICSIATFQSESYLALIRNFCRYSWLLMYLFGASPAVSKSFFTNTEANQNLKQLDADTLFLPWATSLRMSELGYTNNTQSSLKICYNTLHEYINSLAQAIKTPHQAYKDIGIKQSGRYCQLNTNLLQIENEYYSNIRPKRVSKIGEKPLTAICKEGVEYIEVRCIDINPFEPLGLSEADAYFLDVFLTFSVLIDSSNIDQTESHRVTKNFSMTVSEGRKPGLMLHDKNGPVSLRNWGLQLMDRMVSVAEILDKANDSKKFSDSICLQREKLFNVELTPSARHLNALKESQSSYIDWMNQQSVLHSNAFREKVIQSEKLNNFNRIAQESKEKQSKLEASDKIDLDGFLTQYFAS